VSEPLPGLGLKHERELWSAGYRRVAGLDEVGRGAWAGPVVAAAVILPPDEEETCFKLREVRDSKVLSPLKREALAPLIAQTALAVGIGLASAQFIDRHGIVAATRLAMLMAVRKLPLVPHYLLIDALQLPDATPQRGLIHGDAQVLSIAAASIVAKVFRDGLMEVFDGLYEGYGLARNKGYGTEEHIRSLRERGPTGLHRTSFRLG